MSRFGALDDKIGAEWKCATCTYENHADLHECEICGTPKVGEICGNIASPKVGDITRDGSDSESSTASADNGGCRGGGDFIEVKKERSKNRSKDESHDIKPASIAAIIKLLEESKNARLGAHTKKVSMPAALHKHVNNKTKHFCSNEYTTHTLTLKTPSRNSTEDEVYANNPELLSWISRAHTLVVKGDVFLGVLEGPMKFSGKTDLDEDPDDEAENAEEVESNCANKIYDHDKVMEWQHSKKLKIVRTTKENGKFAIMTIISDPASKELLVVFGSKNYHIVVKESDFFKQEFEGSNNNVIRIIYESLKVQYAKIKEVLLDKFLQGYSLVGESCDGQHFTDGDGQIKWFSLFKNGSPLDVLSTLTYLRDNGLSTVDFAQIYDSTGPDSEKVSLDSLYLESRCMDGEGCVLYNVNSETMETILVKTKAVQYIVKRMLREKIKNGFTKIDTIRNRFVDAKTYHGLSTEAAVRVTNQLISFGLWMMNKSYPGAVLGHAEVKSVRGQLPNGFNTYWKEYVKEHPTGNITISKDDFGPLNEGEYLERTKLYPGRNFHKNVVVVFIQGIQGSGKSTIAHTLQDTLCAMGIKTKIVEQDICYGDTQTCQSQLFHWSSDGDADVLIVSRCNINEGHYKRYLAIAEERFCKVVFFSPRVVDELYFAVSIAGILNRSEKGDKLLIGRFELDIDDVIGFTYKNFLDYEKFKRTDNTYGNFTENEAKLREARDVIKKSFPDSKRFLASKEILKFDCSVFKKFVRDNVEQLNTLRRNVDEIIGTDMLAKIRDAVSANIESAPRVLVHPNLDKCIYIGLFLSPEQRTLLLEFARPHLDASRQYTEYCEHVTQVFGVSKVAKLDLLVPFSMVEVTVDSLQIEKGFLVYSISSVLQNGKPVLIQSGFPHITCFTPLGGQPKQSVHVIKEGNARKIPCDFKLELKVLYQF